MLSRPSSAWCPIYVAHGIRRHTFRHGLFVRLRSDSGNQGLHRPIFSAADPDAPFEAGVPLRIRLRIAHIDYVVAVNKDSARPTELLPLREKFAFLVEDLDAAVAAVADKHPPCGIDRNSVKFSELPWGRPLPSPRLDKLAVLRKLDDPRVGIAAMSIGHENIAARRSNNGRGPIECVLAVSRHARFSKGQQNLSIRTELDNLVAFAVFSVGVGYPHVAVPIDVHPMRKYEHARAEPLHCFAGPIKLEDGREVRFGATAVAASLKNPDVAVSINVDRGRRSPFPALGIFRPALFDAIRVILRVY